MVHPRPLLTRAQRDPSGRGSCGARAAGMPAVAEASALGIAFVAQWRGSVPFDARARIVRRCSEGTLTRLDGGHVAMVSSPGQVDAGPFTP